MRTVTVDEAAELFPSVWESLKAQRSGVFARSDSWWHERVLRTPEETKATPRRLGALDLDGSVQAYAIYKTTSNFEGFVPQGKLDVVEAIGATPHATAEIWRYLLDLDLMATIHTLLIPPDHPLFLLLANPRRARYTRWDGLWIRLVDVGAALSGRAYAGTGSVVFDVRDVFCPWNEGTWKLEGGTASRTDEPAELSLDVDALGSAYLGAVSFAELRDALRVDEHVEGALARADAVFGWRPLPWCPEIF